MSHPHINKSALIKTIREKTKKSKLTQIIKEQLKHLQRDLPHSRSEVDIIPTNHRRNDDRKFMSNDVSELPSTYNSSPAVAYYLCGYVPGPHGTGNGCYGFDSNGQWTSPTTGAVVTTPGCIPWHMGGNCYGWYNDGDIPSQALQAGEKACNPNCIHS